MPDWTDAAWRDGALAWAHEQLAALEIQVTGELEQPHVYPWATVFRLPTDAGPLWLKASAPALGHEGAVIAALAERRPDLVPELVAHDGTRGLALLRDAGLRLRELLDGDPGVQRWQELLPLYAELQLTVAADRDALVAAGAPDRGAALLPPRFAELVRDQPDELRALVPLVTDAAARLAEVGVPESIQHDDLHDGQVFVRDG